MQPEEEDPGLLVGRHVVEVGMRQAWPYLTFADPDTGREVRVYVDASIRLSSDPAPRRQDDEGLLAALDRVNMQTVESARAVDGGLELVFFDESLTVDGEDNDLTTTAPWRVGLQRSADPPAEPDRHRQGQDRVRDLLQAGSDLSPGFTYPPDFVRVVALGLIDLEPWRILRGEELWRKVVGLAKRYPESSLVPFAVRVDNDDVACWDRGLDAGQVVIVHDWASPGWERQGQHPHFADWFRQAVEDCLELGSIEG